MVNHEDRVFTLLIESNPYPHVDDVDVELVGGARYLETLEQRSNDMTQVDRNPVETKPKRRRMALAFGVGAAVILIGGLLLINQESSSDVAAQTFSVEMDAQVAPLQSGPFTASGSGICPDGTVTVGDSHFSARDWWFENQWTCADGSGSFTLRMEGDLPPADAPGDVGTWTVLSGTGDYTNVTGNGDYESNLRDDPCCAETYTGQMTNN